MSHSRERISTAEVLAPAKINLRLKVTGQRDDGYHLLDMLNITLDMSDRLMVRVEDGPPQFLLDYRGPSELLLDPAFSNPEENLVIQAARAFFGETVPERKFTFTLEKQIPAGGGLGGGSSDAAAVANVLGSIAGITTDENAEAIRRVSALGADIPYLLQGGLMRVRGIGDLLEPLDGEYLAGVPCVLVYPGRGLETARIFHEFARKGVFDVHDTDCQDVAPESGEEYSADLSRELRYQLLVSQVENDLEPVIIEALPSLGSVLGRLRSSLSNAVSSVTGTGSTLFVLPAEYPTDAVETGQQLLRQVSELIHSDSMSVQLTALRVPGRSRANDC